MSAQFAAPFAHGQRIVLGKRVFLEVQILARIVFDQIDCFLTFVDQHGCRSVLRAELVRVHLDCILVDCWSLLTFQDVLFQLVGRITVMESIDHEFGRDLALDLT